MTRIYPFIFFLAIISCHPKMSDHTSSVKNSVKKEENLSYANYKFLRSAVKQPAGVLKLKVWNYPFEELPMNLVFAKNLRYFELGSESDLDFEPTKKIINGFSNLEEMSIVENSFAELPFTPDSLLNLKTLYLWNNPRLDLEKLIFQLGQCKKLEKLALFDLSYSILPESSKNLESLKDIRLSGDSIDYEQHFEVLSALPILEAITIIEYQKSQLPEGLGKLNLKELRLLDNRQLDYGKTFDQAAAFKTLETLEISRVEGFTVLPKNVRQFKNLKELILIDNMTLDKYDESLDMESLSEDLLYLPNIEALNLSGSDPNPNFTPEVAKRIPDNIRTLKKLKKLNIDYSRQLDIPHLMEVILELPELKELSLYYITFYKGEDEILPKEFSRLQSLKKLNVGWMEKTIFDNLDALPPQLTHLEMETTSVGEIPKIVLNHSNLLSLNLKNTKIRSIPPEISNLSNLENLDLRDNELTELPPQIAFLKNLCFLDLAGNPCAEDEAFQKQIKEWLPHTTIYFYE